MMPESLEHAWPWFWAKTFDVDGEAPDDPRRVHPLWAHLIDVATVAERLWEGRVPDALKRRLAGAIGCDETTARRWYTFWAGAHDVGKSVPFFQALDDPSWARLPAALDRPVASRRKRLHHGFASIPLLLEWIDGQAMNRSVERYARSVATVAGIHHGRATTDVKASDRRGIRRWWGGTLALGWSNAGWKPAQQALVEAFATLWLGGASDRVWPDTAPDPYDPLLLGFAGWVTLADWLGSNQTHFHADLMRTPPADVTLDTLRAYRHTSEVQADKAVAAVAIDADHRMGTARFADLYPAYDAPRPIQARAETLPVDGGPSLTIIEAPTGEGKTEAALLLAARQQQDGCGGLYVGMPTQATSNSLFHRVADFVKRATDRETVDDLAVVHGGADLHPSRQPLDVAPNAQVHDADAVTDAAAVRTRAWFLPTKRGLLAPYGVGTVDQAFLGTLRVRHFFLRLFALSGKTVIFDEVHAYDTYMASLFVNLLKWLRALGTNVVLLSATLPATLRNDFIDAWSAEPPAVGKRPAYPAVWHVQDGECTLEDGIATDPENRRTVCVMRHGLSRNAIAATVADALTAGATVGVLCNTVRRAQQIYRFLRDGADGSKGGAAELPASDSLLVHARMPHGERSRREEALRDRFGKKRTPGVPGLFVATQVAEQSLDVDVDVMLSDLAPIDLLLQRAGRLHRHQQRHRGQRPRGHATARLHVMMPGAPPGRLPDLDHTPLGYDTVYARFPMLRTWNELRNGATWNLPDAYRSAVEAVYGPDEAPPDRLGNDDRQRWRDAERALSKEDKTDKDVAKKQRVPLPDLLQRLFTNEAPLRVEDDDPEVQQHMRALTRKPDLPSVTAAILHRDTSGDLYLDADCTQPLALDRLSDVAHQRAVLERTVRIAHPAIPEVLADVPDALVPVFDAFQQTSALQWTYPMVFTNRRWTGAGTEVTANARLGLVIA